MRLATVREGRDGRLAVVSRDGLFLTAADDIAPTLQDALDRWADVEPALRNLSAELDAGGIKGTAVGAVTLAAPLPRSWQWLDGSAFPSHGALMDQLLGIKPEKTGRPLMYQGLSDHFLGAFDDVALPSEADGIDFEGEFGVVVGEVPMGIPADEALAYVRLVVQINDWSLRALAGPEMKTGFGWVQAKPACSMAPFAITPNDLGDAWHDGRVSLDLAVERSGEWFGNPNGAAMEYGFHELIAHAARTRRLCAGTIIGSGTVSNADYRTVGSSCIAERRGIEIIDHGQASTPFLSFGETVRMEARTTSGEAPFGVLFQRVTKA